jgi:hypothetical protein
MMGRSPVDFSSICRAGLAACLVIGVRLPLRTFAQDTSPSPCYATAAHTNVNIRNGPGTDVFEVIGTLPRGESIQVRGRNAAASWYTVRYPDPTTAQPSQAWIAARVVILSGTCSDLPVVDEPEDPPEYAALMAVPVLPEPGESLRQIFERGQVLGNDPHVFTKVGDCNTDTSYFFAAFDQGDYDLGPYADLQPTVAFFSGSFARTSLAGQVGFNAHTVLESLWSDPKMCHPGEGEGPLACEYRRVRPSVAIAMFGPNDLLNLTEQQFADSVRAIVEQSLADGVIPVLTTFTWHRDNLWPQALRFNLITVEIARDYDVPVINFWRAAQALPNLGLVEDYTHLTTAPSSGSTFHIAFNGEEKTSGYTLRNLLTLQTLDLLRREVLDRPN